MISSLASVHWPHYTASMTDVTDLLEAIQNGQPQAAEALLPLVYDELRKLARSKLRHEQPGYTLEATALVHEAYLRLVGDGEQGTGDEWTAMGSSRPLLRRRRRGHAANSG